MTTTEPQTGQSDESEFWAYYAQFFTMLEVPTLKATLAEGRLVDVVSVEEMESYAKVAAIHWCGAKFNVKGMDASEEMAEGFRTTMFCMLTGENLTDDEGRTFAPAPFGGTIELTPDRTRHVEWMFQILADKAMADALLAAVPDTIREIADAQVNRAWLMSLEQMVEGSTMVRANDRVTIRLGDEATWMVDGVEVDRPTE